MRAIVCPLLVLASLCTSPAFAVGVRQFVLERGADFRGGDLKGVAVDSRGGVRAGITLGSLPVAQGNSIWSALPLEDGSLLLGTGNQGALLRLAGGQVSVAAETRALVVTSLIQAWNGAVFCGSLPDGKVLKWQTGKLTEFVTLKGAEHVWQLAFDAKNKALYAATGPEGKLYRINQNGEAQVYFDAGEQHLMSVAVSTEGVVYTGSSDKAKLYRITGPGRASVFYDFGRTEVRAITVSRKGEVYAIANEIKAGAPIPARPTRASDAPAQPAAAIVKTKGKGTLVRFTPDGVPDELLDDSEEHFTALALGDEGRVYVGTGIEGRVYTVDANHNAVLIADVEERQIGVLILAGKQRWVAATDPAVLHPILGVGGPDSVWTSKVLDAGIRAKFGLLQWDASGVLEVSTRSGNSKEPDETWSQWSPPLLTSPAAVTSPAGRYLQVRARFNRDPKTELSGLQISFVTDNLRAVITDVGIKAAESSDSDEQPVLRSGGPPARKSDATVQLVWKVDNPDKDELRYRLKYRRLNAEPWFDMLEPHEKLTKESYAWNTSDLPEGRYRVRVMASDELANPPDRVTTDQLESGVILVDNSPPTLENWRLSGQRLQGVAVDGLGPIARIEVTIAGTDEWVSFFPKDGIFDEAREEFDIDLSRLLTGPAYLAVRVYDQAGNFNVFNLVAR